MHPVLKLVVQRIALGLLLLLAVSAVIFLGVEALPGDTAQAILGQSATEQSLRNLREQMGLNQPPLTTQITAAPLAPALGVNTSIVRAVPNLRP